MYINRKNFFEDLYILYKSKFYNKNIIFENSDIIFLNSDNNYICNNINSKLFLEERLDFKNLIRRKHINFRLFSKRIKK